MLVVGLIGVGPGSIALAAPAPGGVPLLRPPLPGPVTVGFDVPEPYGPGHRGLDLVARPGAPVGSPAAGRVHFAGSVAGQRWVTVAPTPGVLVTVGPLADVAVRSGDVVVAGSVVGRALGNHDGREALHLSLRVEGAYVDPGPHLRRAPPRATLLPAGSGPARAAAVADGALPGVAPTAGPTSATAAATVPWSRLR